MKRDCTAEGLVCTDVDSGLSSVCAAAVVGEWLVGFAGADWDDVDTPT